MEVSEFRQIRWWAVIVVTNLVLSSIHVQSKSSQKEDMKVPVAIEGSRLLTIQSREVGGAFEIDVLLPLSYGSGNGRYPVVYLTDSTDFFPTVAGNIHLMRLSGELPEVIVVGIGYPSGSPVMSLRTRDLTPTLNRDFEKEARADPYFPLAKGINPGGAGKFHDFLETELKPLINKEFRTDPEDQTLLGYSFGGLFGLYVLFNHTDAFDRYVIASPSIWYDDGVSFQFERAYAQRNNELAKRVFLSANELETLEDPDGVFQSVANIEKMVELLGSRAYPSLKLDSHVFEGETHQSGVGTALSRGLRFVFESKWYR